MGGKHVAFRYKIPNYCFVFFVFSLKLYSFLGFAGFSGHFVPETAIVRPHAHARNQSTFLR